MEARISALAFLPCLLLWCRLADAQIVGGSWETTHKIDGVEAGSTFGLSVDDAGDVDGDGVHDIISGAPSSHPAGLYYAGSAFVHSGATGALIWRFDGETPHDFLGRCVSGAGDLDGDGYADVLVSATRALASAGRVYVYSGRTGGILFRLDGAAPGDRFGDYVAEAGDVDQDGIGDLLIGARDADPGGRIDAGCAYVMSGASGALIWRFDGPAAGDWMGRAVAGVGDVDGDGVPDQLIGARHAAPGGRLEAGSAFLYSGRTAALIRRFDGEAEGDQFSKALSGLDDVDGDGVPDLVIGAFHADPGGIKDAGSAYVYSGATGSLIHRFDGKQPYERLGYSVQGARVDGDDLDDIVVGADGYDTSVFDQAGAAYIFAGANGAELARFEGTAVRERLGACVAGADDLDGDGIDSVCIASRWADVIDMPRAGTVRIHSLDPFLQVDACEVSATSNMPFELRVDFPATEAGQGYAVLASADGMGPTLLGGIEVPLSRDKFMNRMLQWWIPTSLQNRTGVLDAAGNATAFLVGDPALISLVGRKIHVAAVSFDRASFAGGVASIARCLTVLP